MTSRVEDHSYHVIKCAIDIHKAFGPGLLESVYEALLHRELLSSGFKVERQLPVSFRYKELEFRNAFRIDLLVEGALIIEVKSVDQLRPAHKKQLLTYLSLTKLKLGLILNFGAPTMREGLCRIVNDFNPADSSTLRVNAPARCATPESAAPSPPSPDSRSAPPAAPA